MSTSDRSDTDTDAEARAELDDELQNEYDRLQELKESTDELYETHNVLAQSVGELTSAFDEDELAGMGLETLSLIADALLGANFANVNSDMATNSGPSPAERAGPGKFVPQGSSIASGLGDALRDEHGDE